MARVQGRQGLRADRPGRPRAQVHRGRDALAQPHGGRRLREAARPGAQRGARDRRGAGRALPPAPGDAGARVRAGHAVAARDRGGVPVRGDARPAAGDQRGEGRHGAADPDGPPRVRRRRLRQDRGRGARRVQGGAGRHAGRRARADDAARQPARADVPRALRQLPGAGRGAVALPHREGAARGRARLRVRRGRRAHRHAPPPLDRRDAQEPRAARGRRGAALRRAAQGAHQAAGDERRRAHAHRHARSRARSSCRSPASATSRW